MTHELMSTRDHPRSPAFWLNSVGASRSRKDALAPSRSAARGIPDERLARGELSPTEYRDRLESLHEPL